MEAPTTPPAVPTLTFNDPRTLTQVLTHFFLLCLGVSLAHKSLSGARHVSRKAWKYSFWLLIFLPTFTVASLICRTVFCLYIACTKPWPSDRLGYVAYLVSATLGVKSSTTESNGKTSEEKADDGIYLFNGEFEDFQRVQCLCMNKICVQWTRAMFGHLIILAVVIYYCAATIFVNIIRRTYTWQYIGHELLTGTPPGQHESSIPYFGRRTVSGPDELNAVLAFGGLVVSSSAFVLRLSGWSWKHKSLGPKKERNEAFHLKSIRYSSMDARFELPLAMILFAAFTPSSWGRYFESWEVGTAGSNAITVLITCFVGLAFLVAYISWTAGRKNGEAAINASPMFLWSIALISETVFIYAFMDVFDMGSCLSGRICPRPLFMWKTPWSDTLWTY